MTDRELMQMALDAMLNFPDDISDDMFESIKALRAALAQPEQTDEKGRPMTYWGGLAQPEQEPVAWVAYENGEKHGIDFDEDEIANLPVGTMLYPAPPQREWQGLTDEEIMDACSAVWASHPIEVGRVIQDLLKARNT